MERPFRIIEEIFAWGVGVVFIYAGVIKLMSPELFLVDIESYRLVPYQVAVMVSLWLPPLEVICGLGMMIPKFRAESSSIIVLMTGAFIVALASAWARGLDISCGCFGKSEVAVNYPLLIARDLLIIGIVGSVVCLFGRRVSAKPTKVT